MYSVGGPKVRILAGDRRMDPQSAKSFILAKLKHELPVARTYHSFDHTLDVYASAIGIAEQEGVTGEDLVLLKIAALYHDAGFLVQDNDHEEAGCRIVRNELPGFGFDAGQVERICEMVRSTRIPQSPSDLLSRILCDADLDYLGREDFDKIGGALFTEMRAYGVLRTEHEWNRLQVHFLEQHRYFTATNIRMREPVKQQHLARVKAWLEDHPE
jgi:uncharacterized protein